MNFIYRYSAATGILLATLVLAACGGTPVPAPTPTSEPAPAPTHAAAPESTPTPAPTSTPSPVPASPTPLPPPAVADLDIEVDGDTVWKEVFDTLTAPEQGCIRSALGSGLEPSLDQPVLSDGEVPTESEVSIFSCLAPEVARSVFIAVMTSAVEEDEGTELGEAQVSCLLDSVADIDVAGSIAAMAAAGDPGADQAPGELFGVMFACLPDLLLVYPFLEGTGVGTEELSEGERSCLRDWAGDVDWTALIRADDAGDIAMLEAIIEGMADCVPDALLSAFLFGMGVNPGELGDEEASCVRDWAADADWAALLGPEHLIAYPPEPIAGLTECLPDLGTSTDPFDLGNPPDDAAVAVLGEAVAGTLEYADDIDLFVFEAEAGTVYSIEVELGTLYDSTATLFSADLEWLTSNDDHGDSLASRITWRASVSGEHYVSVGGFGAGTYTLTVTVSDIADDHSDSVDGATAIAPGEAGAGVLEYEGDTDFFTFEAERGETYQVDVALRTLPDSELTLYGPDGEWLAYSDDYGDSLASQIIWEAPGSASYHVEVGGFEGTGSYTLSIVVLRDADP